MKYYLIVIRCIIILLCIPTACRQDANKQAAAEQPCPWWGCSGNNICLAETGTCVKPCLQDTDCAEGFLCKGFFRDITTFSGRGEQFCRTASIPPGELCTSFGPACEGNAVCVDGVCRPRCTQDDHCPPDWKCHLTVLGADGLSERFSYRVCVRAHLPEGAPCTFSGEPTCDRGLVCMLNICHRTCTIHADCPQGQTCSGQGFHGWRGHLRIHQSNSPDFLFCTFR